MGEILNYAYTRKEKEERKNHHSTCEYPCEQASPGHKDGHKHNVRGAWSLTNASKAV